MRGVNRVLGVGMLVASLTVAGAAHAAEASSTRRALDDTVAVAANALPVVSSLYAPKCLPGYIFCKIAFAFASLGAAADQWLLSGAQDVDQTSAIIYRGFQGDWYLTGRHIAGEVTPQPLPDPPPPAVSGGEEGGKWEPPPL